MGGPCLGLRVGFPEFALATPWPRVRWNKSEPLYLGCVGGGRTHHLLGLVSSSTELRRDAHWLCGVRGGDKYTQLCCGTSQPLRSRAGVASP